jgi:type IV secretory pathway VirB9-like protein
MKKVVMILLALLATAAVCSAEVDRCKTIHRADGRVYTINASLHKAAHVILPEPLMGQPINGNVDLWQVEAQGNHLFIKPTTKLADGAETSVTVIGVSNTSYDFRAVRSQSPDYCVEVKTDGGLIQGGALSQWVPPQAQENIALRQQLARLQGDLQRAEERTREQVEDAMLKYRGHIYTRYDWSSGGGFMGKNTISDIWDDGRWTYVRVANDNKGLLTVSGLLDGKKELIEYQYDRENMIYKIVGIYPKLFLRYGDSEITVSRADERTAGAF